jgi:putative CocE/NonD family hydrolase
VSFPTSGQIFRNASYRWAIENTEPAAGPALDDAAWNALDLAWYRSGKPYRDLDLLSNLPSRIFRRWLNHPSYDRYWQKMVPSGPQFGKVDIPALSITGYYANGSIGSLFYFDQLAQYAKNPNQTLLLGPWNDAAIRSGPAGQLPAYALDPAALVDLRDLRFQWLDHVFKGSPLPLHLGDHVNYEVMGANEWRHVPSLAAMSNSALRFYLDGSVTAGLRHLAGTKPAHAKSSLLTVRFADRGDASLSTGTGLPGIPGKSLAGPDRLIYIGEPVKAATELAGSLSGHLDFKINKMDVDLNMGLYEQLPDGQYLQLAIPCEFRASYAGDRSHRHLLKAGERQQLDFRCEPIFSRRIGPGSRIAFVLGTSKRPDREINYGGGDDVSAESIDDGREPLKLQWFASSYIELPVKR